MRKQNATSDFAPPIPTPIARLHDVNLHYGKTMALLGTAILMFVIGYGINLDMEDLTYAVLDHDQTILSRNYTLNLYGSRYFVEHPQIIDYADLDQRMRSGELALAIEIPHFPEPLSQNHRNNDINNILSTVLQGQRANASQRHSRQPFPFFCKGAFA